MMKLKSVPEDQTRIPAQLCPWRRMQRDGGQKQTRLLRLLHLPSPLIVWTVETRRRGIFDNSNRFLEGHDDAWNELLARNSI